MTDINIYSTRIRNTGNEFSYIFSNYSLKNNIFLNTPDRMLSIYKIENKQVLRN